MTFAVIGDPVAHSRSPEIHAAFAAQFDIALSYERIATTAAEFVATVERFRQDGGRGLNVTLPFKEAALALCDDVSGEARRADSVNTLSFDDDGIRGDNTDGPGLVADLIRLQLPLADARICVVGAGGAARGILAPLLGTGPAELVWTSRNPWIVQEKAPNFADLGPIRACTNLALKGDVFDLVINATSAGHRGECPRLCDGIIAPGGAAYDLSYGPAAQPFLTWAAKQGATHRHDGHGMLIEQAAVSFAIWHGRRPDTAPLHAAGTTPG